MLFMIPSADVLAHEPFQQRIAQAALTFVQAQGEVLSARADVWLAVMDAHTVVLLDNHPKQALLMIEVDESLVFCATVLPSGYFKITLWLPGDWLSDLSDSASETALLAGGRV